MPNYGDPVLMVRDIRQHVLETGHQVASADDPLRQMMGYVCMHCQEDLFWYCSASSLKSLSGTSCRESNMLKVVISNSAFRVKLTEYLNDKTMPQGVRRVSRYERPWVI